MSSQKWKGMPSKIAVFFSETDRRSDDTAFGAGKFSWQDPVYSWKVGPGDIMTVENKQT